MELVFVRHAQGEHTQRLPQSLQLEHPGLTATGMVQAERLACRFPLTEDDCLIVSPTRRTLQTALGWAGQTPCTIIVHQAVGPRMFPPLPASEALPCDKLMPPSQIIAMLPQTSIYAVTAGHWESGINAMAESDFVRAAGEFLVWCKAQNKAKLYIVSHDGTITAYRRFLGEVSVGRRDFLGETGAHGIIVD